jgi:hypothetical protein
VENLEIQKLAAIPKAGAEPRRSGNTCWPVRPEDSMPSIGIHPKKDFRFPYGVLPVAGNQPTRQKLKGSKNANQSASH